MKSSKCCLGNIFQSWVPPSWRNVFWSCEMCGKLGSWSSFSNTVNHSTHFRKFWFLQLSHFLTPKFLRGNNFHFWHLWLFPAKTGTHLRFMCVCVSYCPFDESQTAWGYKGDTRIRQSHTERLPANFKMLQKHISKWTWAAAGAEFGCILTPWKWTPNLVVTDYSKWC